MSLLFKKLKQYEQSDFYPFHMPGHKRNLTLMKEIYGTDMGNPFGIDITEIDGFDDLHHAEGILKTCMEEMASAVSAKQSYFVVNGSSGGILTALYAACPAGSRVAVARNCHRSVAHGIQLRQLVPYYIYPQINPELGISLGISCADVEDILEKHVDIRAVIVTSPTYEGIVSDIRSIAEAAHRHGALLIVDEAHGAHLPFGKEAGLPAGAVREGADIVVQSLHKTLPALTQSAALHICSGRVDRKRVEQGLRIFETSSPSYVMMAGMDACMRFMKKDGGRYLERLTGWLEEFYRRVKSWQELSVLTEKTALAGGAYGFDRTKLVFGAKHMPQSGGLIHRWLVEDYHLQPEMSTPEYVVLMSTVGDTKEGIDRLIAAMEDINRRLGEEAVSGPKQQVQLKLPKADVRMLPWNAAEAGSEPIEIKYAEGRISAEIAYIYPPGIPFLMPGERIGNEHVRMMSYYRENDREICGLEDEAGRCIRVVSDADERRKSKG